MKIYLVSLAICFSSFVHSQQKDLELWYKKPAATWTDALPIGNGRIGAMLYGSTSHEIIQLNEESVWAGSKMNNNNPEAKAHLPEIQAAIFRKDYKGALDLSKKYMIGTPPNVRSYQPLGNLFVDYQWKSAPTNYRRSLNINNGISTTSYSVDGNNVVQEAFASAPHDALIVRIKADKPVDFLLHLSREFSNDNEVKDKRKKVQLPTLLRYENKYQTEKNIASYSGQIIDQESINQGAGGKHMRYAAAMKILSINGKSISFSSDTGVGFNVSNAREIVLMITGATDYDVEKLDVDPSIDPLASCMKILSKASNQKYPALKNIHETDHRSVFERIRFSLGDEKNELIPTDERLAKVKSGGTDNGLIALYYQYGRYLLMGSSRLPAKLPANLQGIWNDFV